MSLITDDLLKTLLLDYSNDVFRLVETQEYAATTSLVDNFDEQSLLEAMLDGVKPNYFLGTESKHYLIKTPFRYPPLKHGSRFGSRLVPSYFYASESVETVFCEVAYYRFLFLSHMSDPYQRVVNSEHMIFSVQVQSSNTADLTLIDEQDIQNQLTHKSQYSPCQQTGDWLRTKGIDLIRYGSARDENGINVAISLVDCIKSTHPENMANWLCQSSQKKISFTGPGQPVFHFYRDQFLMSGVLPNPAD